MDILTLTEQVRAELGLPAGASPDLDDAVALLCDDAILRSARACAADAALRPYVLTDPATTTAPLDASGVAGLTALVRDPRVLLDLLNFGEITHPDLDFPLRPLATSAQGALASALDALIGKYWIEGSSLYTRSTDGNQTPLSGSLALRVPYWPTLAQYPDALVGVPQIGLVAQIVAALPLERESEKKK